MRHVIGLNEFKSNISKYEKKVLKGDSFYVVHKTKPVFKVTPAYEEKWEEFIDCTKVKNRKLDIFTLLQRL